METDFHYLKKILNAHVYDVAMKTSLDLANHLSKRLNNKIYLKREDTQPVFSFKVRGAYNKMSQLSREILDKGVVTASAGNHAQGVAYAAARLNCKAVIVVPTTAPQVKLDAILMHGKGLVEIIQFGESFNDAFEHAQKIQQERHLTFVPPFDDPDIIAGQGTIAIEILQDCQTHIDAIFVPIGGGGLAAGIATCIKAIRPETKVIGVQTEDSCAMAQSLKNNQRITLQEVGLFSDGTAIKQVGEETLKLCAKYLDEIILVNTDALCTAIKDVYQDTRAVLEPSGALSTAGMKAYIQKYHCTNQTFVAVISGANINFDRLRFVVDRIEVGEMKDAMLAVKIPEQSGSFKKLCTQLGNRNVTEFNYRICDSEIAHVLISLQTDSKNESEKICAELNKASFEAIDLSHDEVTKHHLRYMIGGHAKHHHNERLFRFSFPEYKGALMKFLSALQNNWNISLFHYRHRDLLENSVLVGFQIPKEDTKAFQAFLDQLGYLYTEVTDNQAYQIFLL